MRNAIKNVIMSLLVCIMLLLTGMVSLAGQWEQDNLGIWSYRYHDGDLLKDNWYWIDGNLDGTAECYCFDAQGSMYQNTVTPDGYTVDSSGAWVEDGVLQTRTIQRDGTGRPFGMASLNGSVLSNEWSDYRIVIPQGSDMKDTVAYMEATEADPEHYDLNMLTTDEQGSFSMFIWYYKDSEPGISAASQMRKHNYDLIHRYNYPEPFVEMELTVGGHGFSATRFYGWGYGHIQFKRKVDDMVMDMTFSYPDRPESEEKVMHFIESIMPADGV